MLGTGGPGASLWSLGTPRIIEETYIVRGLKHGLELKGTGIAETQDFMKRRWHSVTRKRADKRAAALGCRR